MAVNNIDFQVKDGEIFAFLGPNGAGKSTTIKMLTTLLRPTSGHLTLAGHNVQTDQEAVRKSFGIVFQDPSLDEELTGYENMQIHGVLYGLPRKLMEERITQLLQLVELWDRRKSFVKTYSGGMRRRLEVARGLLHHPRVLFLDEPTLGLDAQTRNLLWDYVKKLSQSEGMTIFFTTHYLEEAENMAERIAIIDHGRIIATGSPGKLKKQTGSKTLEEAYLKLTGKMIREETASENEGFRMRVRSRSNR